MALPVVERTIHNIRMTLAKRAADSDPYLAFRRAPKSAQQEIRTSFGARFDRNWSPRAMEKHRLERGEPLIGHIWREAVNEILLPTPLNTLRT